MMDVARGRLRSTPQTGSHRNHQVNYSAIGYPMQLSGLDSDPQLEGERSNLTLFLIESEGAAMTGNQTAARNWATGLSVMTCSRPSSTCVTRPRISSRTCTRLAAGRSLRMFALRPWNGPLAIVISSPG